MTRRSLPSRDRRISVAVLVGLLPATAAWLLFGGGFAGVALLILSCCFLLLNHRWLLIPIFPYDRIISAGSGDGVTWRRDPGIRVEVGGASGAIQVYSPHVVPVANGFRMYYRSGSRNSLIASALSTDELQWQEEPGARVAPEDRGLQRVEGPYCLPPAAGAWRLYYSGFAASGWSIFAEESVDGLSWGGAIACSTLAGGRPEWHVKDPCVLRETAGYRIWYRATDGGLLSEIWTAISSDGYTWRELRQCGGLAPADRRLGFPSVIRLDDGRLRMFYDEYSTSTIVGMQLSTAVSEAGIEWRAEGACISPGGRFDRRGAFGAKVLRLDGDRYRMYYGGFWESHWTQPYTLWVYRPRHELA